MAITELGQIINRHGFRGCKYQKVVENLTEFPVTALTMHTYCGSDGFNKRITKFLNDKEGDFKL